MEREMEAPGFWDDPERSNQKMKELKNLKDTVGECDKLSTQFDDILTLIDMGYEENDASLIPEIREELDEFIREFDELRIGTLLSGEYDKNNAILKLNAGAGGTESCDWCCIRAPGEPSHATGAACCIVCIPAGRSARALPSKYWTIWMVTKQVSSQ